MITESGGGRAALEVFHVDSDVTAQRLQISVARGSDGAPTLYVLDPLFIFDLTCGVVTLLRVAAGLTGEPFPDLTVIGIGYPTDDPREVFVRRARDLTPTPGQFAMPIELPPLAFGGAEAFRSAIAAEIIPAVHFRYPVDPAHQALAGFSFSGLFALDVLFHQRDLFTGYLVGSPSLWWDNGVAFRWEEAWAREHDDLPARVVMWAGANEQLVGDSWKNERFPLEVLRKLRMVDKVSEFAAQLRGRNYPQLRLMTALLDGEYHLTAPAGGIMRGVLDLFEQNAVEAP